MGGRYLLLSQCRKQRFGVLFKATQLAMTAVGLEPRLPWFLATSPCLSVGRDSEREALGTQHCYPESLSGRIALGCWELLRTESLACCGAELRAGEGECGQALPWLLWVFPRVAQSICCSSGSPATSRRPGQPDSTPDQELGEQSSWSRCAPCRPRVGSTYTSVLRVFIFNEHFKNWSVLYIQKRNWY